MRLKWLLISKIGKCRVGISNPEESNWLYFRMIESSFKTAARRRLYRQAGRLAGRLSYC